MCTPSIRCSMGRLACNLWLKPQQQRGCPHSPSPTTATYSAHTISTSLRKRLESNQSSASRLTLHPVTLRAPNATEFAGVIAVMATTFRAVALTRTRHSWQRPPRVCTTYLGSLRSLTLMASITSPAWTARFSRSTPRESLQRADARLARFTPCFAPRGTKPL